MDSALRETIEQHADEVRELTLRAFPGEPVGHLVIQPSLSVATVIDDLLGHPETQHVMRHALCLRWASLPSEKRILEIQIWTSRGMTRFDGSAIVNEVRAMRHPDFVGLRGYPWAGRDELA